MHARLHVVCRVQPEVAGDQVEELIFAVHAGFDVLAREVGIFPSELDLFGRTKAKVSLSVLKRLANVTNGKYIVVTG